MQLAAVTSLCFLLSVSCNKEAEEQTSEPYNKLVGVWVEKDSAIYDEIRDTIVFTSSRIYNHFLFDSTIYFLKEDSIYFYFSDTIYRYQYRFSGNNKLEILEFMTRTPMTDAKIDYHPYIRINQDEL